MEEVQDRLPGPLQGCGICCMCLLGCFGCALLVAALVFLVWCIVAVSSNPHLQHEVCAEVANVWWTITIMLIIQASNCCVMPCIFGWEQFKMAQDAEYAQRMRTPLLMLHFMIIGGEALFVSIFGLLAWTGISAECKVTSGSL